MFVVVTWQNKEKFKAMNTFASRYSWKTLFACYLNVTWQPERRCKNVTPSVCHAGSKLSETSLSLRNTRKNESSETTRPILGNRSHRLMFRRCRDNNPQWEQLSIFPNIIMILSALDDGHNGKLKHVVNKKSPDAGKKRNWERNGGKV